MSSVQVFRLGSNTVEVDVHILVPDQLVEPGRDRCLHDIKDARRGDIGHRHRDAIPSHYLTVKINQTKDVLFKAADEIKPIPGTVPRKRTRRRPPPHSAQYGTPYVIDLR